MSPQLWAGPPTSPRESVALGPGIGREDEARRQRGWQRGPEPPATWTVEATWPSGAGAVVMAGCLGWRAKPATPQVGAQARVGSLTKPHSGGIRGFGERPEEGRVLRS